MEGVGVGGWKVWGWLGGRGLVEGWVGGWGGGWKRGSGLGDGGLEGLGVEGGDGVWRGGGTGWEGGGEGWRGGWHTA